MILSFSERNPDVTANGVPGELNEPLISVYVDYDNLVLQARHADFPVSFAKLRQYVRTLGRVCEAIVFVPPHIGNNIEVITTLTQSGFEIVLCPFQNKDKDAVDAYIKAHLRRKVLYSLVKRFVIVSEDNDFRYDPNLITFAEDAGREILFVGALELKEYVDGYDAVELPDTPDFHRRCNKAMTVLLEGTAEGLTVPEDRLVARFMSSVFNATVARLAVEDRPHFNATEPTALHRGVIFL
ncbi:MAG: NYN domain-containing protein [bacterium]|nr:NYN domain-containing protein [bacterium]